MSENEANAELLRTIQDEHIALRRLFDDVAASLRADIDAVQTPLLMKRLVAELQDHFTLEEVDGVFDQIERDAPTLASDVKQLRNEHKILLSDANDLVQVFELSVQFDMPPLEELETVPLFGESAAQVATGN